MFPDHTDHNVSISGPVYVILILVAHVKCTTIWLGNIYIGKCDLCKIVILMVVRFSIAWSFMRVDKSATTNSKA